MCAVRTTVFLTCAVCTAVYLMCSVSTTDGLAAGVSGSMRRARGAVCVPCRSLGMALGRVTPCVCGCGRPIARTVGAVGVLRRSRAIRAVLRRLHRLQQAGSVRCWRRPCIRPIARDRGGGGGSGIACSWVRGCGSGAASPQRGRWCMCADPASRASARRWGIGPC
jgi:hypothetical protein